MKINFLIPLCVTFQLVGCTHNQLDDDLIMAARDGDLKRVSALIKVGANINACGSWEGCDRAITEAATEGHLEMVKLLVAHGADLNKRIPTPLSYAAHFGHVGIVKYLLANGATLGNDKAEIEAIRRGLQQRENREIYQLLFPVKPKPGRLG